MKSKPKFKWYNNEIDFSSVPHEDTLKAISIEEL